VFLDGFNGRKVWGKVRATTDLAEIVAQFISYFYRLRDENISNMEDGCRMGGMFA